jgi:undecaprenyl-diphosphatase
VSAQSGGGEPNAYFTDLFTLLRGSVAQLVRPPLEPRHAEAARKLWRQIALLITIAGAAAIVLMLAVDAWEIAQMPPRGAASLWAFRIVTNFGKDAYVLGSLAAMLVAVALVAPLLQGDRRSRLLGLLIRLQFLFFAVLVPLLAGDLLKWIAGRGRPFVGGKDNVLDFVPFDGTEAHASFPSAHAITSFALAFAVAAVLPRARPAMVAYALLIAASRLVLLAHHPSDVVAGALIGVAGAMLVRYWFAIRHLEFAVNGDGAIVPLTGLALEHPKGVAHEASAS